MLEAENICVSYDGLENTVEHVSFRVETPSLVAILGPNGAGKSTLLKGMLQIVPSSGKMTFNGQGIKSIRKNIAYVEQKSAIDYTFPITVKECVSLGLYPHISLIKKINKSQWEKVDHALDLVEIKEFKNRQISELSGGQFQRVLIARALVQQADLLFLDEPFIGIDAVSEKIIMDIINSLKKQGKTVVIVHHDLAKVENFYDNVILIDRKLIAYGETKETFVKENLIETYGAALNLGGV